MKKRILAFTLCLAIVFMFGACGKSETSSSSEVVATVNGEEITMDELQYFLIQAASQLKSAHADAETGEVPEDFWSTELEGEDGKTAAEVALETALDGVVEFHIYKIEADKLGLKLNDEDKENINSQKQSMIDSYGETMYEAQLKAAGFTEETFMKLMTLSAYSQKLYTNFTEGLDEETIAQESKEYFNENYLKAKHILISTQDAETGTPLDGEALEAKQKVVAEVQEKIKNGANFDDLIKEYGEDPGMEQSPEGYVFGEGEMVTEFYEGTKALEIGAISEPVTTSYGFHIIQRLELNDEDYASYEENVKNMVMSEKFVEQLEAYKKAADVKKKSAYKKIDVKAIMEQYKADYEEASAVIQEESAKMQEEAAQQQTEDEAAVPEGEGSEEAPAEEAPAEEAPAEEVPAEEAAPAEEKTEEAATE
ncbi:MAG: hypothetical protein E7399_08315 [Ruminococcaceae bacterium]|nr:hypothetical protein [Oscillospiraceae bacterium]